MITTLRTPEGGRRRRRSVQPVIASRRRRRFWLIISISVVSLALAGYFGFRFFQKIRLEGETFRDGVNRRISEEVGCQVEFTRIYDGGDKSLAATQARFDTRDQDLLEFGTFSNLSASLTASSWVSDEWGILSLSIAEGTINLNPDRPVFPVDSTKFVPHSKTANRKPSDGSFRFGINPEPDRIVLDKIQFTKGLNLEWPSAAGQPPEGIRKLRGHITLPRSGGLESVLVDGVVSLNQMPDLNLEKVVWKLNGRSLDISGGSIRYGGRAKITFSGHADLVTDGAVDLKADFVATPLQMLIPPQWHEAVLGMFSAEKATFHANFGKGPERVLEGDFKVTGAILQGFLFMSKIADALRRPEIAKPEFPELKGHFRWSPSKGLELTGLSGEREDLLRIAGDVSVSSTGAVKGRLKMSANGNALRAAGPTAPALFGPVVDDWAPVEFNLTGTAKAIMDDIKPGNGARTADEVPAPNGVSPQESPGTPAPAPPPPPDRKRTRTNEEIEKEFNDLIPNKNKTPAPR
jgi:hypothetical protein